MKKMLLLVLCFCLSNTCHANGIHEHGYWIGKKACRFHCFDAPLARAVADFFEKEQAISIVDFGCGKGDYVKELLKRGFLAVGYDGNPATEEISDGVAHVLDLSEPVNLGKKFDWVLSLEVGEHLPRQYETIFVENLIRHCSDGIVLSWAVVGQGGYGHFNCRNNDYVKNMMAKYGFINDVKAEQALRKNSTLAWFKNTIMVFRKKK